jgi:hypothetical protein
VVDVIKFKNYINKKMPYKNDLLKVNDESKLKCNEMRKLNE